jgi:uncharacterized protein (TIGR02118 family)
MYRVIVLYDQEPDAGEYAGHVEICNQVPGAVFRHGRIFGSPMGDPKHAYYAEFEFADRDAFKNGTRSPEFMAAGKDVADRGLPQPTIEFAELA